MQVEFLYFLNCKNEIYFLTMNELVSIEPAKNAYFFNLRSVDKLIKLFYLFKLYSKTIKAILRHFVNLILFFKFSTFLL